ncbi:MAG: hypothetical protein KatS3mg002_0589 [Candidatus Woesearchaeota archaeon]|nr:MAG: hypothetical protein KatS3mg002_0589 [Candidatus Woesearchaeota archaeon]
MINTWKEVYTKSQRENLIEKTVASLTELVNVAKQEEILEDKILRYIEYAGSSRAFVYISTKGILMEHRVFSLSDKPIEKKYYSQIIEKYNLEPKKIEELLFRLKNK